MRNPPEYIVIIRALCFVVLIDFIILITSSSLKTSGKNFSF